MSVRTVRNGGELPSREEILKKVSEELNKKWLKDNGYEDGMGIYGNETT